MNEVIAQNVLEVDIGNSFCKWRLRAEQENDEAGNVLAQGKVLVAALLDDKEEIEKLFKLIKKQEIDKAFICSVVADSLTVKVVGKIAELWSVEAKIFKVQKYCAGVKNSYKDATKMGADRWLATIAAKHLYPAQEVCVIDCGTAINVEFLSAQGHHMGGYIIPGMRLMQTSLLRNTEHVKFIEKEPFTIAGTDTASNVVNGSLFIVVSLIEKLLKEIKAKNGIVLLTGGSSQSLHGYLEDKDLKYHPDLVFEGFKFIE